MKILFNYLSHRILKHFSSNLQVRFSQQGVNPNNNYQIFFNQLDKNNYYQLTDYIEKYLDLVKDQGYLSKQDFAKLIQSSLNDDFQILNQLLSNTPDLVLEQFDFLDILYQIVDFYHNYRYYPLKSYYNKFFSSQDNALYGAFGNVFYMDLDSYLYQPSVARCESAQMKKALPSEFSSLDEQILSMSDTTDEPLEKDNLGAYPDEEYKTDKPRFNIFHRLFLTGKYAFSVVILVFIVGFIIQLNNPRYSQVDIPGESIVQPTDEVDPNQPKPVDFRACSYDKDYFLQLSDGYLVWYDNADFVIGKIKYDSQDSCDVLSTKISNSIHYSIDTLPTLIKDNPMMANISNLEIYEDKILYVLNISNQDFVYANGKLMYAFQHGLENSFPDWQLSQIYNSPYLFTKKVFISSLDKFSADVGMYEKGISPIDLQFDWRYFASLGLVFVLFIVGILVIFLRDNFIKSFIQKVSVVLVIIYTKLFSPFNLYYSIGAIFRLVAGISISFLLLAYLFRFSLFLSSLLLIGIYSWMFWYYYIYKINNQIILQIINLKLLYDILPGYYEIKNQQNNHNDLKSKVIKHTKNKLLNN